MHSGIGLRMANFADIIKTLNGIIGGLQNQTMLNKMGLAAIRRIKERTRAGLDVEGNTFAPAKTAKPGSPYSPAHAKKRELLNLPTAFVNLEMDDIGGMLQKVDHRVFPALDGVELDITDPRKKRIMKYTSFEGVGKNKIVRKSWGINDQDKKDIADLVARQLTLSLNQLTGNL